MIDYQQLNNITQKDKYPLPRIDKTLERLGGARYFSAMDLVSGYWQVPMSEKDQQKCALITAQGLFNPIRMPQMLANALTTFQRMMDFSFLDLKLSCVLIYLDDINVFSQTFDDHLDHLREVFSRLRGKNMKLKPSKCSFFKERLEFLGLIIPPEGI